jgi:hypothetical protein
MPIETLIAFFSGIGVTLTGAIGAHLLTRRRDRRRVVEERRFEIYMKLLDLHATYFWFTTAEVHNKPVGEENRKRAVDLSWQIADLLRSTDEVDFLEEVLDVTLSPKFETAVKRYEEMGKILDRMGRSENPRYAKKVREIGEAKMRAIGSKSNAPGASWLEQQ